MLDELKRGVREGFACVKLRKRSKAPVDPDWTSAPVPSYSQVRRWWESGFNIGVRLGEPSKLRDGHYLHTFDIDIRDPDDPEGAFEEAAEKLRELFVEINWKRFPTVQSGSGGKSRHVHFSTQKPFRSRKLARSKETVIVNGKKCPRWEIELFGTGKQVALPPSKHPSGGTYRWLTEPDWDFGIPLIDAEHIEDVFGTDDIEDDRDPETKEPVEDVDEDEIRDMLDELVDLAESRDDWLKVGMALHHQLGPEKGWPLFDEWSKRQPGKYNRKRNLTDWRSFKRNHPNPRTLRSLIKDFRARQNSVNYDDVVRWFEEIDAEDELIGDVPETKSTSAKDADPFAKIPKHLLSIPGKLQHAVNYFNATARMPQPQFAVQTALAIGSVVVGRNYTTDEDNYTSLYLVCVGESGCGKEHARRVIMKVLKDADRFEFVGPREYTSEAAISGELLYRPRHIAIIDELGRYLSANRKSGNALYEGAQTFLMTLFGSLDGVVAHKSYSTRGMSKQQMEEMRQSLIERPALSLMAMSAPTHFYSSLGMTDVNDGFLNRFLIVQTPVDEQMSRTGIDKNHPVPTELIEWIQKMSYASANDEDFDTIDYASSAPEPVFVPFTEASHKLLREIEADLLERSKELKQFGLQNLFKRTKELIMRVALIVALSCESDCVKRKHVEWARDYVLHYAFEMGEIFKKHLGRTKHAEVAEELYQKLLEAKAEGMTERDFQRNNTEFRNFNRRDRDEVLSRLETDFHVVKTLTKGKRGPKTWRYFAVRETE